jgi:hypothetical protein
MISADWRLRLSVISSLLSTLEHQNAAVRRIVPGIVYSTFCPPFHPIAQQISRFA